VRRAYRICVLNVSKRLIRDRVWRTRSQLELVEYVAWFNTERLHTSLGDVPPAEYEWESRGA
jgi:transposase InsO family protein